MNCFDYFVGCSFKLSGNHYLSYQLGDIVTYHMGSKQFTVNGIKDQFDEPTQMHDKPLVRAFKNGIPGVF